MHELAVYVSVEATGTLALRSTLSSSTIVCFTERSFLTTSNALSLAFAAGSLAFFFVLSCSLELSFIAHHVPESLASDLLLLALFPDGLALGLDILFTVHVEEIRLVAWSCVRLLVHSDESDCLVDEGLLDLSHTECEVILISDLNPVLVFVHDLYDWLGDTLLNGEGGNSILELLKACWGFNALDVARALLATHAQLDLDIDVGVVSSVLWLLHGHVHLD